MRLLKDKQQQLANVLDDKQKNLQGLQEEVESKNALLDELSRKKQEVNYKKNALLKYS
jgi:peptidoglycan hydrolase CwlO-like protein